jgi:hypothetical protein
VKNNIIKGGHLISKKFQINTVTSSENVDEYTWALNIFPIQKMLNDEKFGFNRNVFDMRKFEKLEEFVFHATTEENAMDIMRSSLKPITEWNRRVWASSIEDSENYERWVERFNQKQIDTINNARENGVYFYNMLRRAIEQAIVTVERLHSGNPALIILQTKDQIYIDPESEVREDGTLIRWEDYEGEEERLEMPLITFGELSVVGVCCLRKWKLKEKIIPIDIGSLLYAIKYELDKGKSLESFYFDLGYDEMEENYFNESFWLCKCRENEILEERGVFNF